MYLKNRILINIVRVTGISLLLIALNVNIYAQSDNYWSWNFNTMSMLMSGTVVGGNADARKSLIRSNVYDNSEDQFTSNAVFIQMEEEARTRIKSPFSAAFGMSFATKSAKSTLSFTMEYFHKLDPYYLFDSDFTGVLPEPWLGTSASSNLMGGFRTDFTNGDGDNIPYTEDGFKINQVHLNKYHVTLGPVIKLRKIQLITGVQYTFGTNEDVLQGINYSAH